MGRSGIKLDFIGIGAEKAATTWLAACLREHPEVCIPKRKELFFFNDYDPHFLKVRSYRYQKGISWYKNQFGDCKKGSLKGEITPTYLYEKVAARRIKKHFPDIKILVILRNPAERTFSQYVHDKRLGLIKNISFEEALKKYDAYKVKSLYFEPLSYYFSIFGEESTLVLLVDDIKKNPAKEIKKAYKFLEVGDINFRPSIVNKKVNRAGKSKLHFLNYLMINAEYFLRRKRLHFIHQVLEETGLRKLALYLRDINSTRGNAYPRLNKSTKDKLVAGFKPDIEKLEKLIGRRLDSWKK